MRFDPRITLSVLTIFAFTITSALPVRSQERTRRSDPNQKAAGTIELDMTTRKKDPYLASQEATLNYLIELKRNLQSVSSTSRKLLMPESEVLNYLGGLYLFCSLKRGTCPAVLEALFEVDVVNSKLGNATVCPVMKSFWKRYLDNDFEDRLKYGISTGFVSKVNEFNSKVRPRYLRCEDTLKDLFKDSDAAPALFSKRYQTNSRPLKAIDETIALINAVTQNQTNVFIATGAQS